MELGEYFRNWKRGDLSNQAEVLRLVGPLLGSSASLPLEPFCLGIGVPAKPPAHLFPSVTRPLAVGPLFPWGWNIPEPVVTLSPWVTSLVSLVMIPAPGHWLGAPSVVPPNPEVQPQVKNHSRK